MDIVQQEIQQLDQALKGMTCEEQRRLEELLGRLSTEQIAFVRDALQCGRSEGRLPVPVLNLLESYFETWWTHSLAEKMAILACITSLSGSADWLTIWTDHGVHECPAGGALDQARSLTALG